MSNDSWIEKIFKSNVYFILFDDIWNWEEDQQIGAFNWYTDNYLKQNEDIQNQEMNCNWWFRFITGGLGIKSYKSAKVDESYKLDSLAVFFSVLRDKGIYFDLNEHKIGVWITLISYYIVIGDGTVKETKESGLFDKQQMEGFISKYHRNKEWEISIDNLFIAIYKYGFDTAFAKDKQKEFDQCIDETYLSKTLKSEVDSSLIGVKFGRMMSELLCLGFFKRVVDI